MEYGCIVLWYWCRSSFPWNYFYNVPMSRFCLFFLLEFPHSSNTAVRWNFLWTDVYKRWFVYFFAQAKISWIRRAISISAMAVNISAELLSGKVCTLEVRRDNTIRELKETIKKASCWTPVLPYCCFYLKKPWQFSIWVLEKFEIMVPCALQVFYPCDDEVTRKLRSVELLLDGEKLALYLETRGYVSL